MMLKNLLRAVRRSAVSDPARVQLVAKTKRKMVNCPITYNQDGLATIHNCEFMREPRFAAAYALGKATGSWGNVDIQWRAYVVCWAAQQALALAGDFVECGVNRGGYARTVIAYTGFDRLPRRFYLLDTFAGLVEKYISDDERRLGIRAGGYVECYDAARQTFAPFPNVTLVRGAVPETLSGVRPEKVAFLSLDMNCAAPEVAAAKYFWDKLATGAVIVLDDYGWPGQINQKQAFDGFAAERGVQVLALPTGQGLIIKP